MKASSKRIKLEGKQFGEWKVLEYVGDRKYRCQCSCGIIKDVRSSYLRNGNSKSCGHDKIIDLTGRKFGELSVIEYSNSGYWKCQCSCGKIVYKHTRGLRNGQSVSCGHIIVDNLCGQTFGELTAIEYVGNSYWKCKCSCGNEKNVRRDHLINGRVTSCGHKNKIEDLTGRQFNEWTVLKYVGDGHWECRCSCGKIRNVSRYNLVYSRSKSCGHKKIERLRELSLVKRDESLINALKNEKSLRGFIGNEQITYEDLANKLGITYSYCVNIVNKLKCTDLINKIEYASKYENEIIEFIRNKCNINNIENHNRTILKGRELDIYIPEKQVAVEFNGDYWHSSYEKSKQYHQQKTIDCAKQGIRLIHIFEYEWINEISKEKIKNLLYNVLGNNKEKVVYGRNTIVKSIDKDTAYEFEDKYHLQNSAKSEINIGCIHNGDLICVMSLSTPRSNKNYQYEIIRCTFKQGIQAVGVLEKMFDYFVNKYKPSSVIAYADISKFTGNSYIRLGFKTADDCITEPNYIWVSSDGQTILNRYNIQKKKITSNDLGTIDMTEDEIMNSLNFLKIYDSGNLKLEWNNGRS